MLFAATIRDASGTRRAVTREAASEREAIAALRAEGVAVLSLGPAEQPAREKPFWHPAWLKPVTGFDIETGLDQMASMLRSGVSLLAALETVSEQALSPRATRLWARIRDSVAGGRTLSEAMSRNARLFGGATLALVRVGEQSGEMEASLRHAARQLESARNLRSLAANALAYPVFAIVAAVGVCVFLVVGVIPKIADFLESGGAALPALTQSLIDVSAWLHGHGAGLLAGLALAGAALLAARLTPPVRLALDAFALRLPVVGRIARLSGTAAFSRAMEMLVGSGVTLLDSLDVAQGLLRNTRLRRCVRNAYGAVLKGGALAPSLRTGGDFMPMLPQMVAVGETTGSLPDAFAEVARFSESMLAVAIKRFSVTVEPVMIVVTGLVVGYVYVAFFMALFSMAGVG